MFHWEIKPRTQGVAREKFKTPVQILQDKIDLKNTKEEQRNAKLNIQEGGAQSEARGLGTRATGCGTNRAC
jgi:hypothetical protein